MTKSDTIGKLADALAKAQGMMKGAIKDSTNPFFKQSYADLSSVWEAAREPLSKNGLSVIQTLDNLEDKIKEMLISELTNNVKPDTENI